MIKILNNISMQRSKLRNYNSRSKILPKLNNLIRKTEKDVKNNRNLSAIFSTRKEINKYLNNL
jgi:ribosomal protein S15P/S13E